MSVPHRSAGEYKFGRYRLSGWCQIANAKIPLTRASYHSTEMEYHKEVRRNSRTCLCGGDAGSTNEASNSC